MVFQILVIATLVAAVQGFQPVSVRSNVLPRQTALSMKSEGAHAALFEKMKKAVLPIVLGASIMLGDASNAEAARSGGRSGGSSFRSSPSPRSSTQVRPSFNLSSRSSPHSIPHVSFQSNIGTCSSCSANCSHW